MSEIHACRNNFSRGISTSWSDKEHMPHPRKKIFFVSNNNQFLQFLWVNYFPSLDPTQSFLAESYYPPPPLWGGG